MDVLLGPWPGRVASIDVDGERNRSDVASRRELRPEEVPARLREHRREDGCGPEDDQFGVKESLIKDFTRHPAGTPLQTAMRSAKQPGPTCGLTSF